MKGAGPLFVLSWILLVLLTGLLAFGAITSTMSAFGGAPDNLTPTVTVEKAGELGETVAPALHGRRVTAATWALAYALLLGFVALVPYRRRERWAWWALLLSLGVSQLLSLARIPALGIVQGSFVPTAMLIVLAVALAAGAPRMFMKPREAAGDDAGLVS
jgi:hypothetical protein